MTVPTKTTKRQLVDKRLKAVMEGAQGLRILHDETIAATTTAGSVDSMILASIQMLGNFERETLAWRLSLLQRIHDFNNLTSGSKELQKERHSVTNSIKMDLELAVRVDIAKGLNRLI